MNVNNFENQEEFNSDTFIDRIFARQFELLMKYKDIEKMDVDEKGHLRNLQTYDNQRILKDFAWRTMEEIAESIEASNADNMEHQLEELADGLHFITELCILAGIDKIEDKDPKMAITPSIELYTLTEYLGVAMNFLKSKAWKQTSMYSDEVSFKNKLIEAYKQYLTFCRAEGFESVDLFNSYQKKNQVNEFRIKTKY